ncbi:sensor histidine kinase [Roseateles amylovorans]|uniref:Histidine kinase n=1 Tax=Roseateles amylovorans TaxID=2978473 RepID=A0ABY6B7H2_9BURK|nr:sensor histidine kinase [Roseateles amylovorans]UXH80415.1 histidine kinase [Roseateles amylovorans]
MPTSVPEVPAGALKRVQAVMVALCTAALAGALSLGATAALAASKLTDYAHTPLLVNDGAPADIWTLSQADDGVLWLGTGMGLFRFDGLRFDRYPLREGERLTSSNINGLKLMADGDIWLGFHGGGTARLRDGRATLYGPKQGLPPGKVLRFALTGDGVLWAAASGGLARFVDGRWQAATSGWGLGDEGAYYVFVDSRGILWVCTGRRLMFLRPGAQRFEDTGIRIAEYGIVAEDRSGRIWLSESLYGIRPLPELWATDSRSSRPAEPKGPPPQPSTDTFPTPAFGYAKQMLFARDGSLWLTVSGAGVWRLLHPEAVPTDRPLSPDDPLEKFDRDQGLPANVVVPIIEDREGTVWVGTNNGISSFQKKRLHEVQSLSATSVGGYAVLAHGKGVVAGNLREAFAVDPPTPEVALTGPIPTRTSIASADGALWWRRESELIRRKGSDLRHVPLPPHLSGVLAVAMTPDGEDGLWLSVLDDGIYHATPSGVVKDERLKDLPAPRAMGRGPDGSLWLASEDQVIHRRAGQSTVYGLEQGLAIGRATTVYVSDRRLLIAGESGVALFDGKRFHAITDVQDSAFGNVTGIIESLDGDLWLSGGRGVIQMPSADVASNFAKPSAAMNYRLLDRRDGLPGVALQATAVPTALRDGRGRLWFTTNRGIAWLDPAALPRNERPPHTEVLNIRTGERTYMADDALTLPAGTTSLTLRYTAITLVAADRARFRYRLEGVDRDWHDAGAQREATYANLAPGEYRFQVMAANGDGVWDASGANLRFSIAPTWFQTRGFALACLCSLLLLGWLAYRLRIRAIAKQVRLRLEERHLERERIARELHDTLLQGVQGLVLQFNRVARRVDAPEINDKMERALANAENLIAAARDRVSDLRANHGPLGADLTRIVTELADDKLAVVMQIDGNERALREFVHDELLMIAREALCNAVRHASATTLSVHLRYDERGVTVQVADDGRGLDPAIGHLDGRPGHHGIRGMFERAKRLQGTLRIRAGAQGGTEVEVRVLAQYAYAPTARDPLHRLVRALGRRLKRWAAPWLRRVKRVREARRHDPAQPDPRYRDTQPRDSAFQDSSVGGTTPSGASSRAERRRHAARTEAVKAPQDRAEARRH